MSSRRRGGGGHAQSREATVSKAMSWILRHGAKSEGLQLDPAGYAQVDKLLAWHKLRSLGVTFEELKTVVADNDKQRFSLIPSPGSDATTIDSDPSAWLIRANQGHSITIQSSSLLQPITLDSPDIPETALHGTYYGAWPAILESGGMSRMGRNHMHFAAGVPGEDPGVISGMRADAQILIYIDIRLAMEDDVKFWRSDNGVVLTEGNTEGMLPLKYFKQVADKKRNVILWDEGKEINQLPEGLRSKPLPRGKGYRGRGRVGRGRGGKEGNSSSFQAGGDADRAEYVQPFRS